MKLTNRRLPNKNTKTFTNGKPLCTYILNTLCNVNLIDEVFVYCSDDSIKQYLPDGVRYLRRDESLDSDNTKMNEVLIAFSKAVESDVYIMSHTTAPFISSESLHKGIEAVLERGYDSAFSAKKIQDFLWENGKPINYCLDNIPRTQDLNPLYMETSGFYVYRREIIECMRRRIGNNPFIVEVNEIEAVDIDEEIDFKIADAIYNYSIE